MLNLSLTAINLNQVTQHNVGTLKTPTSPLKVNFNDDFMTYKVTIMIIIIINLI